MIRAIIFDCDGVIADTEPLHCRAFTRVLAEYSISLTAEEYFAQYVGLNDPTFLRTIFEAAHRSLDDHEIRRLLNAKNDAYLALIEKDLEALPGVVEFVARAAKRWPLAVCSGARRVEIEIILRQTGLSRYFPIIVSSDDVAISKPDPAGFLRAMELLRQGGTERDRPRSERSGGARGLSAAECLVIEDSAHGIAAAKAAGMRVLAVLSRCSAGQLSAADVVVPDLRSVSDDTVSALSPD
jgi:beta-phosphoglucomutase